MKKLSILLISLIIMSFVACKKSNLKTCCGANIMPLVLGERNSTYWVSQMIDTVSNDSVTFYGKTDSDMLKVKFEYKSLGSSLTRIKNYTASYYTLNKGTVINSYKLDTTAPDTLNAQYNKTATGVYGANSLYGEFALKFKISNFIPGTDTTAVKFRLGKFYALFSN
jgi:hypothetical protein